MSLVLLGEAMSLVLLGAIGGLALALGLVLVGLGLVVPPSWTLPLPWPR
jgi:hypothetical protein